MVKDNIPFKVFFSSDFSFSTSCFSFWLVTSGDSSISHFLLSFSFCQEQNKWRLISITHLFPLTALPKHLFRRLDAWELILVGSDLLAEWGKKPTRIDPPPHPASIEMHCTHAGHIRDPRPRLAVSQILVSHLFPGLSFKFYLGSNRDSYYYRFNN